MNILILDDDVIRQDAFDKAFVDNPSCVVWHAFTAEKAIDWLSKNQFDLILLDHDLGTARTGKDVVRFLIENKQNAQIIVHSWNVAMAREMWADLSRAGYSVLRVTFGVELIRKLYDIRYGTNLMESAK